MRAGFGAWCGSGGTRMRCRCGGAYRTRSSPTRVGRMPKRDNSSNCGPRLMDEWAEQRLDAGESAALVPELVARVAADPLRERPRGQLMHALYRSGRTADALASYQDYRRRLRDELGLTPSVTLRHLEEAILREDPSLDGRLPAPESMVNLPAALVRLIGREAELRSVPELFDHSRLVTFVGPGGAGKTSLAIAAAGQIANRFRHGVWFVPLAQLRDPSHLPAAVAEALGLSDPDARSVSRVVSLWLATHNALLVVDNCEHLIDECAQYLREVLGAAADVSVLATSREPLGIPGEVQLRVPPLATDDAVLLFSERARAVRPDYRIDGVEDRVREIAVGLDGMPLAIELAAARVNTMTVAEISARLDDRFALLTSGPRTAHERHRSLRAVVDWSYDLLGELERQLLRRLAVFRGGWTLEAAAACVDMTADDVMDPLSALVDRSLVVADDGRFRSLETIRAYAEARLVESGEYEQARERHALYYTALAERAEPELRGGEQAAWLARLRAEDANLRLAARLGSRTCRRPSGRGVPARRIARLVLVRRAPDGRSGADSHDACRRRCRDRCGAGEDAAGVVAFRSPGGMHRPSERRGRASRARQPCVVCG